MLNCDAHDNYDPNSSQGMGQNADGFGVHIPKAYIYAAMGFSALVETLNILARNRRAKARRAREG